MIALDTNVLVRFLVEDDPEQSRRAGYVGDPATRFWVHIDDQPGATCWH